MLWRWFVNIVQYFEKFKYLSRTVQVLLSSLASMVILSGLGFGGYLGKDALPATLVVLVVSAPVAFTVWRFRDENQSKDINLKEFQKISEWVTGAHFGEAEKEKHTQKFSGSPENGELPLSERSREYHQTAENKLALHTFSKRDGAVGLQIAAVYNLLPFYRGDYGRDFEKPAVHLLLSAWKVLQHDILQQLEQTDDLEKQKEWIGKLHERADTPLGQAITRVLLACGHDKKPLLHRHKELLRGICLSGMNFQLSGLEREILKNKLFYKQNLCGAQLQGIYGASQFSFSNSILCNVNFLGSVLIKINFSYSELIDANFSGTELPMVNFSNSVLDEVDFKGTFLEKANFLFISKNPFLANNLLDSDNLLGSIISDGVFFEYELKTRLALQEKGLIIFCKGNQKIIQYLVFKAIKYGFQTKFSSVDIPYFIDLEQTRAANPDWEIWIK